jgi:hypothetical protein
VAVVGRASGAALTARRFPHRPGPSKENAPDKRCYVTKKIIQANVGKGKAPPPAAPVVTEG